MTKIMTSIIAFDLIQGDLSLDDKFIISENAWTSTSGYSSMFIMVVMMSVENL